MKKDSFCKCGHSRLMDHRKKSSIFGIKFKSVSDCQKCNCTFFVRREFPDKSDTISTYLIVGLISFMVIGAFWISFTMLDAYNKAVASGDPDKILETPALTIGDLARIMPLVFMFGALWFGSFGMRWFVEYKNMKNRRISPIDESSEVKQ